MAFLLNLRTEHKSRKSKISDNQLYSNTVYWKEVIFRRPNTGHFSSITVSLQKGKIKACDHGYDVH